MQVFVDNLGQDIQTACGGVDGEHQGLGGTEDNHAAKQVEPRVAHHGKSLVRGDTHIDKVFVGCGEVLPRIQPLAELCHRAENHGAVYRLQTKLLADEQVGQDQQDGVDDGNHHREADVDAHPLEDVGQHDGQTRDGTHNQLAGNEEIIDANARHEHSEGHDKQLDPELFADQSLPDFFHYVIKLTHNVLIYNFLTRIICSKFEAAKVGILF